MYYHYIEGLVMAKHQKLRWYWYIIFALDLVALYFLLHPEVLITLIVRS